MIRGQKKHGPKLCFVASSGGHLEQLKMLSALMKKYDSFVVTEKTSFVAIPARYKLLQSGHKDPFVWLKLFANSVISLYIMLRERPDYVITTGTLVVIPIALLAKFFGKKVVYIESFAKLKDGTKTGLFLYKYADLFIVQWESLLSVYPNAVLGGSIY